MNVHLYYVYALKFLEGSVRNLMVIPLGWVGLKSGEVEKLIFHHIFFCAFLKNTFFYHVCVIPNIFNMQKELS